MFKIQRGHCEKMWGGKRETASIPSCAVGQRSVRERMRERGQEEEKSDVERRLDGSKKIPSFLKLA